MALLWSLMLGSGEAQNWTLQKGDLPLLIVAPHGGTKALPDCDLRQRKLSADPQFTIKGDSHTAELARALAKEVRLLHPRRGRPSLLTNSIHRKYVDLNRSSEHSSHDPVGRSHHREFHQALDAELNRLVAEHGRVLLLDIHGQVRHPHDLLLGTNEGASISQASVTMLWGQEGVVEQVEDLGYRVNPHKELGPELFRGGYITRHYGSHPNVDGIQLEHGPKLRYNLSNRYHYLQRVTRVLVAYLEGRHSAASKTK